MACSAYDDGEYAHPPMTESALSGMPILGTSLPPKTLALTFDDGPGDRTIELSSYLKGRGIRATFFDIGRLIPGRQNVLAAVMADGHLLGNHTQDHPDLTTLGGAQVVSQLTETDAQLAPFLPSGPFLFRAPYLAWNTAAFGALSASPMKKYIGPVSADIGTQLTSNAAADWACWQQSSLATQQCGDLYLQEIERVGRGIVLMHDPYSSAFGSTVDMVKYLVPILQARGYAFVRADQVPAIAAQIPAPPPPPPPSPSAGITIARGESVGGYVSDVVRWRDSARRERSAALVRNDVQDPMGSWGGYVRRFTYVRPDGRQVVAMGSDREYPGWGYTSSHQLSEGAKAVSSRFFRGTYETRFAGPHHAVHQFQWTVPYDGGTVRIFVEWLFATGHDHPLWTATFDAALSVPDAIHADNRSPAGLLHWDGGADGNGTIVSGVGWGDRYKFQTTSAPESRSSSWTYATPNTVPYVWMWSTASDSEMGAVQTQDWQHRDAGYGWLYQSWGRTSANKVVNDGNPASQSMPAEWNWTYQLNQDELPVDPTNKRLAWAMNYGSIGQRFYSGYGDDRSLSGYPYQSHSVFMVLGPKTSGGVTGQVAQIERALAARLTATRGTVRTTGPRGVMRNDMAAYSPAGWNAVYATWEVMANASSGVTMTLDPKSTAIEKPIFRVFDFTAAQVPQTITLNGATLTKDVDYFASLDTGTRTLWLTLDRTIGTVSTIVID